MKVHVKGNLKCGISSDYEIKEELKFKYKFQKLGIKNKC